MVWQPPGVRKFSALEGVSVNPAAQAEFDASDHARQAQQEQADLQIKMAHLRIAQAQAAQTSQASTLAERRYQEMEKPAAEQSLAAGRMALAQAPERFAAEKAGWGREAERHEWDPNKAKREIATALGLLPSKGISPTPSAVTPPAPGVELSPEETRVARLSLAGLGDVAGVIEKTRQDKLQSLQLMEQIEPNPTKKAQLRAQIAQTLSPGAGPQMAEITTRATEAERVRQNLPNILEDKVNSALQTPARPVQRQGFVRVGPSTEWVDLEYALINAFTDTIDLARSAGIPHPNVESTIIEYLTTKLPGKIRDVVALWQGGYPERGRIVSTVTEVVTAHLRTAGARWPATTGETGGTSAQELAEALKMQRARETLGVGQ